MNNHILDELLTETLRPKVIDELILPERILSILKTSGATMNFIFYGPSGTGKTSAVYALCGGKKAPDLLYLNGSDDGGRISIVSDIKEFCTTRSAFTAPGKKKIVFIDEVDGASAAFFESMRSLIETYERTTRFIFTCNHIEKIPDFIRTRFQEVSFFYTDSEESHQMLIRTCQRTQGILRSISVNAQDSDIYDFVKVRFPDWRKILNDIQVLYNSKNTDFADFMKDFKSSANNQEIIDHLFSSPSYVHTYGLIMAKYQTKASDVLLTLGTDLSNHIIKHKPDHYQHIPGIICTISEAQSVMHNKIDIVILLLSVIYKIQLILSK